MISACETEDGVVFDMSELEADALRSYADGLVADPKHPFVELLRSQGLVVGDAHVLRTAGVGEEGVLRADARVIEAGGDRMVSVIWPSSSQIT